MNKLILVFLGSIFFFDNWNANANSNFTNSDCIDLKDVFANASAQFVLCAIDNSRPIKLCEHCIESYMAVLESYKNMSKLYFNDSTCLDTFVNQDRLQILEIMYSNSEDLWLRAKCYDCYTIKDGIYVISNQTKQFLIYYEKFINCANTTDSNDLCPHCLKSYNTLHNYYTDISDINEKISYCMDLVDIMNDTWTFWSMNCCKYRRHDEYIFIGLSIAVLVLTVAFYLISQFYADKRAPMIIQQRRFAESVNSLGTAVDPNVS